MLEFSLPAVHGLTIGIIAIVAAIIIFIFPHILNYIIGILLIASGAIWIAGGAVLPGILSILLGILILIFPHILNYLVAIYLILLGLWFIFAASGLIIGIISIGVGILIVFVPDILNIVFGAYLLVAGFIAIAHYYGWF
jgi:hypothetical protein